MCFDGIRRVKGYVNTERVTPDRCSGVMLVTHSDGVIVVWSSFLLATRQDDERTIRQEDKPESRNRQCVSSFGMVTQDVH